MKALYKTSYSFYKENQKQALNFVLLSDLHFSSKIKSITLQSVVNFTTSQKPDYIIVAGDIVNCLDEIDSDASLNRLTSFFEQLSSVAPVIAILGNHDFYRRTSKHKNLWRNTNPSRLVTTLSAIPKFNLLRNSAYEDDKIYIYDLTPDSEYYCYDSANGKKSNIFSPDQEDKNILLHNFKQIPDERLHNLPKQKLKLFLSHSPNYLGDNDIQPYLSDFDAIISGHMHNGVVPPALTDIWLSDRGIMSPGHNLFPSRTRNAMMRYDDPNIILGAIQTIQPGLNPTGILSHAFPIFVATLTFSDDTYFKHRPRRKHEYL